MAAILRATWPLLPMPVTIDPPARRRAQLDRRAKAVVEPVGQRLETGDFGAQHAARDRDVAGGASPLGAIPLHRCRFAATRAWLIASPVAPADSAGSTHLED